MTRISPNYEYLKRASWSNMCYALTLTVAAPSAVFAQASRTDVLECVVEDESRFVLESRYKWRVIPIPGYPSREYERESWRVTYRDRLGHTSSVPASVQFRNKETRELIDACSHFGMWNKTPLAPYSYLRSDGTWLPLEHFPWGQLDVNPLGESGSPQAERAASLAASGVKSAAFLFAFIAPDKSKLIYEQPLYDTNVGYQFARPVIGVFQAESSDGGATWSKGEMTITPRIFEVGKGRTAQRVRAVPVLFNGKKVLIERP